MKKNTMNLLFGAAGLAALGYAATKVPWAKVRSAIVDAEGELGAGLKSTVDRWASSICDVTNSVLDEPQSSRSSADLHS